ncbi:SpoIIE family protein phosphatase [Streptomyces sp. LP11]|uniref:SpoIIE family protein phosphatase n=1 Tax=Streptomyces pyxinicus TaxID=2970331 RepID=A0ABT2B2G5_9ACTN|nr:SpoIIE family protein phosphatase [Streptomyces sp. LP11]MCS0602692.1 SpoIIE family protein phosphatase [Streptomyces sp. LP11]
MSRVWEVRVHGSPGVADARTAAREACGRAGLAARADVAELVATELATGLLRQAGSGLLVVNLVPAPAGSGSSVQVYALGHGPGVTEVPAAPCDGYGTAADALQRYGVPGRGTVAAARIDPEPGAGQPSGGGVSVGGIALALGQAEECGDAWGWARSGRLLTLLLADGLGHGARAALAADTAVAELRRAARLPPGDLLRRLHTVLRPTRGAAVAVAQVDTEHGELCFAGVGNIGARLRVGDRWSSLISHPGIVGAHFPARVPLRRVPWRGDSLLVVHSDGLPSRWSPPDDPRLLGHDPPVVAATILRDAGGPGRPLRDDTSVAVLAPDRRTRTHDSRF